MMEAGVVIDVLGNAVHWHLPPGRSGGSLPDSQDLWEVLWKLHNEQLAGGSRLLGFAHSHPGRGPCGPSYEDITTFEAIERALGRRLHWWIINEDHFVICRRGAQIDTCPPVQHWVASEMEGSYPSWVYELAKHSGFEFEDRRDLHHCGQCGWSGRDFHACPGLPGENEF